MTTAVNVSSEPPAEPPPDIRFRRSINLFSAARELWHFRELVRTLAEREFRVRYKRAALGFGWAVLTPVVMMVVFTVFFKRVAKIDTSPAPYALYSYLGLLPWSFLSTSVSQGGQSLVTNSALLNKVYCPREVFPLSSVIVAAVDMFTATLILGVLFAVYGYAPHATSIWVPVLLVVQFAFAMGVSLIASSTLVYLRDLRQALPILLQLGLFATPVAYGMKEIPDSIKNVYAALNPIATVIDGYREAILYGNTPNLRWLGLASITSAVVLVAGYSMFKRLEAGFADVA